MRVTSSALAIKAAPGHGANIEAGLWVGLGILFTLIMLCA